MSSPWKAASRSRQDSEDTMALIFFFFFFVRGDNPRFASVIILHHRDYSQTNFISYLLGKVEDLERGGVAWRAEREDVHSTLLETKTTIKGRSTNHN
jgi:hypothetical protein